jgi:vitamin B12 transporter
VAQQSIGTWNRQSSKLAASGMVGKLDFSVSAGYSKRDNYSIPPQSQEYYQTREYHKYVYSANVGWNFSEDHRLGVVYSGADGLFGNPGAISPVLRPDGERYYSGIGENVGVARNEAATKRATSSVDLFYEGRLPEYGLSMQLRYFMGKTIMEQDYNRKLTLSPLNKYHDHFRGANALVSWNNDILYLTAGVDYYREEMTQDDERTIYNNAGLYRVNSETTVQDKAVYLLGKLNLLSEALWFNFGGRYDEYVITNTLDTNPNRNQGRKGTRKLTSFSPAFGATYMAADWLKLRANFSRTFKVPSTRQLVNDSITATQHSIGNPDLRPETARSWEFGFDAALYGASLSATYFMSDFKDMISARSMGYDNIDGIRRTVRQYHNLPGITRFRGIEVFLDWDLGRTFDWGFELRPYFTAVKLFKLHEPDGEALTLISDLNMNYGLVFGMPESGLQASVDVTYYGHQRYSSSSASLAWFNRFGRYTVVDLHVSKTLYSSEDMGDLSARVDVYNVGNQFYMTNANYVMPERTFLFSLKYEF